MLLAVYASRSFFIKQNIKCYWLISVAFLFYIYSVNDEPKQLQKVPSDCEFNFCCYYILAYFYEVIWFCMSCNSQDVEDNFSLN